LTKEFQTFKKSNEDYLGVLERISDFLSDDLTCLFLAFCIIAQKEE
jgi:hypothetical protein